jgi:antitoxin ParD1/3/4
MAKETSIVLGDHFDDFINQQLKTGRFASASEVICAALRLFEQEESLKTELIKKLQKAEKSGFVKNLNRDALLNELHNKYLKR